MLADMFANMEIRWNKMRQDKIKMREGEIKMVLCFYLSCRLCYERLLVWQADACLTCLACLAVVACLTSMASLTSMVV